MAALAAGLLTLSLAGAAAANGTAPLVVSTLELEGGEFSGASVTGAWRLESPDPQFGGVSGLLVEGRDLTAITDQGRWIAGRRGAADVLEPEIAIVPMRNAQGGTFGKAGGDAEGLTRREGRLIVSFERDHRIATRRAGHMGDLVRTRAMERLSSNSGMEALATLPDGRLLAIAEEPDGEGFPVFVVAPDGEVTEGRLPRLSRHNTTGADIGPDGRLYLLQRHFSVLTGFSIRVRRYSLGDDGLPDPDTAETLAAWESPSGIDNMEGIAAFRDTPDGPVKLWLVSDDNFNVVQRTVLVELKLDEKPLPASRRSGPAG